MKNAIYVLLGLVAFSYIKKTSGKGEKSNGFKPETRNIKSSLEAIKTEYGDVIAEWVDRIYRFETRNYQSGQFRKTGTPGMEITPGTAYPWGWKATEKNVWSIPDLKPVGTVIMKENQTGKKKEFIVLPSVYAGMKVVADYLQRGNRPGRWFSTVESDQKWYEQKLKELKI